MSNEEQSFLHENSPKMQLRKTANFCAEMTRWIAKWKWLSVWEQLKRGEAANPFHRHWTLMSIEKRAGRLRRIPRDIREASSWENREYLLETEDD